VTSGANSAFVHVGSTVVVSNRDGTHETFVVVPPADAQPRNGLISRDSPVGRALLGRQIGESVLIPAPGGSFTVTIESIA
jgi:transcription elongation factor GreA